MKTILTVFFLSTFILSIRAQPAYPLHQDTGTTYLDFPDALKLTDTARADLITLNGDTIHTLIGYSSLATLEKMQYFVYAFDATHPQKLYDPNELMAYTIYMPKETLHFRSLENTLGVASAVMKKTPLKEYHVISFGKNIFLNLIVDGELQLYKVYSYKSTASPNEHYIYNRTKTISFASDQMDDDYSFTSNGVGYCYKKAGHPLVMLTTNTIQGLFAGCPEAQSHIINDASQDENEIKKAFTLYNQWKEHISSSPTRY